MKNWLKFKAQRGQGIVEYALILAAVIIVAIVIASYKDPMVEAITAVFTSLANDM